MVLFDLIRPDSLVHYLCRYRHCGNHSTLRVDRDNGGYGDRVPSSESSEVAKQFTVSGKTTSAHGINCNFYYVQREG